MTNSDYDWVGQSNLIIWYSLLTLNFLLLRFNYNHKTKKYIPGIILFAISSISATALFLLPEMLFQIWNYVALGTLVFSTYTLWRIVNLSNKPILMKIAFLVAPVLIGMFLLFKCVPDYVGLIMLLALITTSFVSILSLFYKGSKTV